jgi:hypothetical protein
MPIPCCAVTFCSGPVTAGLIGHSRRFYRLFGDTSEFFPIKFELVSTLCVLIAFCSECCESHDEYGRRWPHPLFEALSPWYERGQFPSYDEYGRRWPYPCCLQLCIDALVARVEATRP